MMYFKTNVPTWERIIRAVMGLAVIGWAFFDGPSPLMAGLGIVGGVILACTGFLGFCPMCALVGRRLARSDKS
jgi:hypothetical protein